LPEQSSGSAVVKNVRKYGITSLAIHLAGFALGTISIALVFSGNIGIESGLAVLTPFADALYGLGLVMVVAVAARAGVPMKHLVVAGAVIGVGLFFKSAPHEFHIASGLGFGLPHNGHVVMGTILITISVVALAVLAFVYNSSRSKRQQKDGDDDRK
jgi:hypothetical protein